MFRNYLKTAWRNLIKNPLYTLINLGGLTLGLSVGMLILLWVFDELGYDRFHSKTQQIYKLENLVGTGASQQIWQTTVSPIGDMAKKELPAVKDAVRFASGQSMNYNLFSYGDKTFTENNTTFVDASFFTVFDFPLIKGNAIQPFADDQSVVLTETTASKYFGTEDPIGKVLKADEKTLLTVTGIIKDIPKNSSIRFDMFMPFSALNQKLYAGKEPGRDLSNDFHQFNYHTYLLLQPGTEPAKLAVQLRNVHLRNKPDDTDLTYLLMPLQSMHLYRSDGSDAGMSTIRMFMIIGLLILLIACINYINLSTARSMLRAKEVSLRKIIGAARMQLFLQFIIETALLLFVSILLAVGVMYLLLPVFNEVSGKNLSISFTDTRFWRMILYTALGTLVASSMYPALLLSSFRPLSALKGKISAGLNDVLFRRILVVIQFTFSIVLVAGTFVIGKQMDYIRSRELGYDKEHVLAFQMRGMKQHYDAIKTELLKQESVIAVTRAGGNIVRMGNMTGDNWWEGKGKNETFMVHPLAIDKDFIPFFRIQLLAGQNYTGSQADSMHFILNETAVKTIGFKDPIGKRFRLWQTEGIITGVVKDFHFASMKQKIEPAVFSYQPKSAGAIYIKTRAGDAAKTVAAAGAFWKQYNAAYPYNPIFLDESFNSLYKTEQRTGTLFNVFAVIAIIISCLGLFGLAAFTAQVRTREIGVRKVLGAGVSSIVRLLAKDFIGLVFIAILVAVPVAWYLMHQWLQEFAYKTEIGWMVFFISGALAIVIAMVTISFQSVKAALANPVKSLRSE